MAETLIGVEFWISPDTTANSMENIEGLIGLPTLPSRVSDTYPTTKLDQKLDDEVTIDREKKIGTGWRDGGQAVVEFNETDDVRDQIDGFYDDGDHRIELRFDDGSKKPYIARITGVEDMGTDNTERGLRVTFKIQTTLDYVPA